MYPMYFLLGISAHFYVSSSCYGCFLHVCGIPAFWVLDNRDWNVVDDDVWDIDFCAHSSYNVSEDFPGDSSSTCSFSHRCTVWTGEKRCSLQRGVCSRLHRRMSSGGGKGLARATSPTILPRMKGARLDGMTFLHPMVKQDRCVLSVLLCQDQRPLMGWTAFCCLGHWDLLDEGCLVHSLSLQLFLGILGTIPLCIQQAYSVCLQPVI